MRKTVVAVVLAAVAIAVGYYLGVRLGGGPKGPDGVGPKGPDDEPIIIGADSALIDTSAKTAAKAGPYVHGENKDGKGHNYPGVQGDSSDAYFDLIHYAPTCIKDANGTRYDLASGSIVLSLSNRHTVTISSPNGESVDVVPHDDPADVTVKPPDYIQLNSPIDIVTFYQTSTAAGMPLTPPIRLHYANMAGFCP